MKPAPILSAIPPADRPARTDPAASRPAQDDPSPAARQVRADADAGIALVPTGYVATPARIAVAAPVVAAGG